MDIKVLGPGCINCVTLYNRTQRAAAEAGLDVNVEKVTDFQQIMKYGVMKTPALVVNGEVKVSGRVPTQAELVELLKAAR